MAAWRMRCPPAEPGPPMANEGTSGLPPRGTRDAKATWPSHHVTCGVRGQEAMAAPRPLTVVPGEASESDSEQELLVGPAGGAPGAGLKVPGEASETEEEEEEEQEEQQEHRPKTSPVQAEEPATVWGGGRGSPSLLQQRLREGTGRLQGAVGSALRQSYGSAARSLGGLEGALGRAQVTAAAAAHCLRLARRDLRAVADTIDIVTACRLLPDIRVQL